MSLPQEFSATALAVSFAAGLLTGLNPCCYSAVPAVLGYLGAFCRPSARQCVWLSSWMGLGTASANMLLGGLVIFAGTYFGQMLPVIRYALAVIPIIMGLIVLDVIPIRFPKTKLTLTRGTPKNAIASYLIGIVFSLAVLPCVTPALASILSYASIHSGTTLAGLALLAAYTVGIAIPIVAAGSFFGFVTSFAAIARLWPYITRFSGILLIAIGVYLLWMV